MTKVIEISSNSSSPRKDAESDYDSGDDSRSEGEIEGIAWEMRQLESMFPQFQGHYQLKDRLGEGTFSSVYKAVDLLHDTIDNSDWCSHCKAAKQLPTPDATSSDQDSLSYIMGKRKRDIADDGGCTRSKKTKPSKICVAMKRIYVTSSPIRILNELDILNTLRGHPNLAHLITAFRQDDQVIAVMPYEKHEDFRDFYRTMNLDEIRTYFRNIFGGLEYAHKNNIIHRDIKPANFLYNPATGHGALCDFGLAEVFQPQEWHGKCLHSLPCASLNHIHGKLLEEPQALIDQVGCHAAEWQKLTAAQRRGRPPPWMPLSIDEESELEERKECDEDFYENWEPVEMAQHRKGRVGHLKTEADRRPTIRANRAGTRGFRAPEVLLKCPDQTISLDVWSVGIILLSFLTRRFPFFQSNDDTEALMEIAAIFGKKRMDACAAIHNRSFVTNVPSVLDPEYTTLHRLVHSLNPRIFKENTPTDQVYHDLEWYNNTRQLYHAIDLLRKTLALDCTKRITARDALLHPFLSATYPDSGDSE